jgi:hypothetical protein
MSLRLAMFGMLYAGLLCGMTPKQIGAIQHNASIAEHNIARPEVWRAVLALADMLKPGIMNGPRAAPIILHALTVET